MPGTRLTILALLVVTLLAACSGSDATAPTPTPTSSSPIPSPSPSMTTPAPSPSVSPTPSPPNLPPGVPATYRKDVEAGDLPAGSLVPAGADVTETEYPSPDTVVVTYASGSDPFAQEHGLVVWRRFPGEPDPWRARFGFRDKPNGGVLGIQLQTADVTGDGQPDVISFENVGGSGVCGTWRVLSLSPEADTQTYARDLCDATVDANAKPVGIRLTESVFRPGDPHCCPSSTRETVLTWTGARWKVASSHETSM